MPTPPAHTPPTYHAAAFHCPSCHAFAQHRWPDLDRADRGVSIGRPVEGFALSVCSICEYTMIWAWQSTTPTGTFDEPVAETFEGQILWPAPTVGPPPHPLMPEGITPDYEEARAVLATSPRSACALLRVAAEKLCLHLCRALQLGEPSKLDAAIGLLVANGLSTTVQQGLDNVRVIGNDAVHAGQIDVHDTPEVATVLMVCMNLAVEQLIAVPQQIAQLHQSLPKAKLDGIATRDRGSNTRAE